MATITFTDGAGAVTITNAKAGPGSRFSNWTPDISRVSNAKVGVGTGVRYEYLFRQDFIASFEIEHYPVADLSRVARLKAWALAGNTFTVNTEDKMDRTYLCRMAPESEIQVAMEDRTLLEYTLSLTVMSAAVPPVFLDCLYR